MKYFKFYHVKLSTEYLFTARSALRKSSARDIISFYMNLRVSMERQGSIKHLIVILLVNLFARISSTKQVLIHAKR